MKSPNARKAAVILAGSALFALLLFLPIPQTLETVRGARLDENGRKALAGLAFALILWIGEALPFHITGLGAMLLLAALGVQPWPELVKSGFGDEAVIFFIGVLILASAIGKSGLAARLMRPVMRLSGGSTRLAVLAVLVAGALLSMWLTALAAAALVLPSAKALLEAEGEVPGRSSFGRSLGMAVAWGPLIGACASPAGSGSNPVVVRFLAQMAGFDINFLQWMLLGVPVALLLIPAAWVILIVLFPPERRTMKSHLAEEGAAQALSHDEKAVALVFGLVAALWLLTPVLASLAGTKMAVSAVACLGATALFIPGVTSFKWKDLEKAIDWSGILLIATGIALGQALYRSGAAAWVSAVTLGGIGALPPFWRIAAVVAGVLAVKVVFSSNTLTGTVIVPLVIALGATLGIDARLLALAGGFAANLAVILVTTSPVNVLPWTTGYFSVRDMARAGLVFAPFAALAIALVFSLLSPAIGL